MKISILCSDLSHPVRPWLERWQRKQHEAGHSVRIFERKADLKDGQLLFLVSCHEIVRQAERDRFDATLVLHASDLPRGRGWSPHVWQIIHGHNDLTVSLIEAADGVDTGRIWAKRNVRFEGHELSEEINARLFQCELELMDIAVTEFRRIQPQPQGEGEATYYRKRTPEDSRIDPSRSIVEQFNLLRVADPQRYPAFFDHLGCRYLVKLEKVSK